MKKLICLGLVLFSTVAMAADAECEYFDKEGKASAFDPAKVPDGVSVEAKSVNMLPADIKQKLYDGSITKCVTCEKDYIKCKTKK
jgi:hypothetical protein